MDDLQEIRRLVAQLWNPDDEVRASLRMEILRYGSLATEPLIEGLDKLDEYSYEAGKVLVEIGQPAVEPLRDQMEREWIKSSTEPNAATGVGHW